MGKNENAVCVSEHEHLENIGRGLLMFAVLTEWFCVSEIAFVHQRISCNS